MPRPDTPTSRRELGDFIRAQRERMAPQRAGLAPGGRRRTPGLRREEAASLCGLSVTWYTWLEQGRDVTLSAAALAGVARGLGLDRAARAYIFDLAGRRDPQAPAPKPPAVDAGLAALLTAIAAPAYVLDQRWNAIACNTRARRLFRGWLDRRDERNLLRFIFLEPVARAVIVDYEERARRVLAEFRAGVGAHLADPALRTLVGDLRAGSALFARLWEERAVLSREGGLRRFRDQHGGVLVFDQSGFNLAADPDLKLTVLVPAVRPPPKTPSRGS